MKKIARLTALVMAVCMLALCLAACQSPAPTAEGDASASPAGDVSASPAGDTSPAPEGDPTKDTFIFAQGADPRGLDPAMIDDGESAMAICNMYEGLVQYAADSTAIEPCLATSWDVSEDGLTYTFKLREGVKFHDGTDFNADAVKFNIDRQLPPNDLTNMPYSTFTFGTVKDVEVVDEHTVKLNLTQPNTALLANLAMSQAAPIVSPTALKASATGNINEQPCGTGPFKFVKWEKAVAVTMVRNDEYWGEKPQIKNLIIKITPENSSRAAEMMAGTINAMNGVDAASVEPIKEKGGLIFEAPGMNVNYMAFYTPRAPFDNPKVREAIVRAINVDEMVKSLYQGYSQTANSVLPTFIPGYNADTKPYEYDVEKSKALLAETGNSDLKIKMITYTNPRPYNPATGTKLAEAVQGYLSKVGVTAEIQQYDWTTYKEKVSQGEGDIAFYGWNGDNGDPDNFMNLLADKDPAMNIAMYNNPAYNEHVAKAIGLPNGPERIAAYNELEDLVNKEAVWLPISHSTQMAAYGADVKNFSVHPTGNIFFARVYRQ